MSPQFNKFEQVFLLPLRDQSERMAATVEPVVRHHVVSVPQRTSLTLSLTLTLTLTLPRHGVACGPGAERGAC